MDVAKGREASAVAVAHGPVDHAFWNIDWICEKWSEDAVEWARKKLLGMGITKAQDGYYVVKTGELTWDNNAQCMVPKVRAFPRFVPVAKAVTSPLLRKLGIKPEEEQNVHGNLLLNEGIQEMWDLIIGATGVIAYNNTNAQLGVGSSTAAADASQTDLQDANAVWKGMVSGYPSRTAQTMDFRSDFLSGEANFAWNEWSVRNGATRNRNMNRKVESLGTKSGGTWTLTASITLS